MSAIEVLDPGALSLNELAVEANREHACVQEAGVAMVEHAIQAGLLLLRAKSECEPGSWLAWQEENLEINYATAIVYMRVARYRDDVRAAGSSSLRNARRHLVAIGAPQAQDTLRKPEWMREEAVALRQDDGLTFEQIAEVFGVSKATVHRWLSPAMDAHRQERKRERRRRQAAAQKALREQERQQAIRRAVRKAGSAEQELYAMAERMQDIMGQAHREATDPEKRKHYALAGEHYRKMRDEIVRALGVQ